VKRTWLLILCVAAAAGNVGCQETETMPTQVALSPREMTHVALTVVSINVQQTLDAQATKVAMTPLVPPTATPMPTRVLTRVLTLTATPTPTATPTSAPPPESTPELVPPVPETVGPPTLPLGSYFLLELDRAETRHEASILRPAKGRFLVLFGAFVNLTDERQCIYSRFIRLGHGDERYVPGVEAMGMVRHEYDIDYPGPINGQCLEPHEREATFILFDVPEEMTTFDFLYHDQKVGALILTPREDGTFAVQVAGA
jgi:hypothetical protein